MRTLLSNIGADPFENDCAILSLISGYGGKHLDVVKELVADPRLSDSPAKIQQIIQSIQNAKDSGCKNVARLLQQCLQRRAYGIFAFMKPKNQ